MTGSVVTNASTREGTHSSTGFDVHSYVSTRVFDGIRVLAGEEAKERKRHAIEAVARAKADLAAKGISPEQRE